MVGSYDQKQLGSCTAVGVLADEAGDPAVRRQEVVEGALKGPSSLATNCFPDAEELDEACNVMLHPKGGLLGVGLGVVTPFL